MNKKKIIKTILKILFILVLVGVNFVLMIFGTAYI